MDSLSVSTFPCIVPTEFFRFFSYHFESLKYCADTGRYGLSFDPRMLPPRGYQRDGKQALHRG